MADTETVIGLVINGDARAYPIQVMIWHEIANDVVGGVLIAVTFCPLCNAAVVFDRRRTLNFGSGGLEDVAYGVDFAFAFHAFNPDGEIVTEYKSGIWSWSDRPALLSWRPLNVSIVAQFTPYEMGRNHGIGNDTH